MQRDVILINGAHMQNEDKAVRYLAEKFDLGSKFRGDMDDLGEKLAEIKKPTDIVLMHDDEMLDSLKEYGENIFDVLMSAAGENDNLDLLVAKSVFESGEE